VTQDDFLQGCAAAVQEADFICCHVYWDSVAGLRAFDGGMRFIRQYLETFPQKPLIISEFSNVNTGTSGTSKGDQYAEFYLACAQYDGCYQNWPGNPVSWPRVQAAYAFILRSPDPAYASQVWIADGQSRAIVERVAARAHMPQPGAMRFAWPTEFRHYTQFYGENQQDYYNTSFAHSLRGGHNGADMHVDGNDPASSPIKACLDGVVTHKQIIETGYGHHATVTSQVEGVGQVTLLYGHMTHVPVNEGDHVRAGEPIGTAGSTGASTGPHLHLSLKIDGTRFPANGDHLNPRPYLDPVPSPRGQPREPYARTYVLLPPGAGRAWARAVVDAAWDKYRFTIGGSADDAGIGDLDFRRVVAVNPSAWGDNLFLFFENHYPGIVYVPVKAESPHELELALEALPNLPEQPPQQPQPLRGLPRAPYARTYVLLPPNADATWARAVVDAAWDKRRFTIGGSADDAGIGDLDFRRVVAVNPSAWGDNLFAFFETYYTGVAYVPVVADTPQELTEQLGKF
jgi:murein DD-endopeptidase MepM/ murein hydrolase activator NlpD